MPQPAPPSTPPGAPPGAPPGIPDPAYWRQLGAHLRAAGDIVGSARAFARYLETPPADPLLRSAARAIAERRHTEAWSALSGRLAADRTDLLAARLLGRLALEMARPETAETLFRGILGLVPGFAPVRADLANALFQQGKNAEARAEADALLASEPSHPGHLALKSAALARLGDFESAREINVLLVAAHPNEVRLWLQHGQLLRALGRRDEAIAAFRSALLARPGCGEAWWNLANLKTLAFDEADLAAIRSALDANPAPHDAFHLRFALARALEDAGDFAAAFAEYHRANAARRALLPPATGPGTTERARRMAAVITPELVAANAAGGDRSTAPIFILGMPRSGSTLLETMLAAHPDIEGTQELPDLPLLVAALDRRGGHAGGYPEILARLTPEDLRALGGEYLASTAAKRRTARPHFIDKQPANWLHAGLIALALPNALVIDMRRDALGCCLSLYRQHFAGGAAYSYALDTLAAEYRAYDGLMRHFDTVLSGRIHRVELARLIADPEAELRSLLARLGLPFTSKCLRFFESDRPVFTPSSEQVRRPLNRDSEALLAGFAPHLDDLRRALGDLATSG